VLISAILAHQVNNALQEAMGAIDLALIETNESACKRRIQQSKEALRRAANLIAANTVQESSQ
jgi:hypothetical protein